MSNKPSVATSSRDFDRKASQITRCMEGYPEGMNPKQIALKTGLNVNTVKSILPKIKGIKKVMRGLYKVLNDGDSPRSFHVELHDWNFHNLIMSCDGASPCFSKDFTLGLVSFSVTVSQSGHGVCRVSTDFPLNVSVISMVAHMFSDLVGVSYSKILISTVEFNKDYRNLRLDGVQSIAVDNLVEQFKVYQKQRGMRIEHKTKVPLSVDSVVDMLSNSPNSVEFNVKLNEHKVALERLTVATQRTSKLLLSLSDKVGALRK
jgi:hypothetical protein